MMRLNLSWFVPLAGVAVALPLLLAYNVPPDGAALNLLLACIGWAIAILLTAGRVPLIWRRGWAAVAGLAVFVLLTLAALSSPLFNGQPWSQGLGKAALLLLATLVLVYGQMQKGLDRQDWVTALMVALLLAGVLNALVGLIQVFVPAWAAGSWISGTHMLGRAIGNVRQPNHLASLLLWACVAAVYLAEQGVSKWAPWRHVLPGLVSLLLFVLVLSGSRTGLLAVLLLVLWGLLDRSLSLRTRRLLYLSPLIVALSWVLMTAWTEYSGLTLGAQTRVAEGASSPGRTLILGNALQLLRMNWLTGVGWGEFNFAWMMTPFPVRLEMQANSHNLPLQLLVELGLPFGLLVLGLLAWAIWQAWRGAVTACDEQARMQRPLFMLLLVIGFHSLLEYPLWYAHFLLPSVFALGLCLGAAPMDAAAKSALPARHVPAGALQLSAILGLCVGLLAALDYRGVASIYNDFGDSVPLENRILRGQRAVFYAAAADYAAATTLPANPATLNAAQRASHRFIDSRLMMVWATALYQKGDVDRARYIVARMRELSKPDVDTWLAVCAEAKPMGEARPFQCEPPTRDYHFREMR